jgi:hypothetical protein
VIFNIAFVFKSDKYFDPIMSEPTVSTIVLDYLKQILAEVRAMRSDLEKLRPVTINRVVDRDPYPLPPSPSIGPPGLPGPPRIPGPLPPSPGITPEGMLDELEKLKRRMKS